MNSPQYLTDPEIRKLLSPINHSRDKAVIVLILSTGIFLSELLALDLESIDFENRQLKISGKRSRKISLNDDVLSSLKDWLEDRPKTPDVALFVTERGVAKRLSERSVDHVIRSYGQENLAQSISYQVLRNTFIFRLLTKTDTDIKTAAKLLGVDRETLDRFKEIVQPSDYGSDAPNLNDLDTRSKLEKVIAKTFGSDKVENQILKQVQDDRENDHCDVLLIGRDNHLKTITEAISHNHSALVTGPPGVGKTCLLKALDGQLSATIFIASPVPFKAMLTQIVETMSPNTAITPRTTTQDLLEIILNTDTLTPPILIIDHLDRVKTSELDAVIALIDKFPIIAATVETPKRLEGLWWKFDEKVPLKALDKASSKQLIRHLTQHLSMNPLDYERLETKVLHTANGNPLAISEMISQLVATKKVTREAIREIDHSAGIVYRDWTGMLAVIWSLLVISRFIALGVHSFEGYILAGIGTALFGIVKYMAKVNR